MTFIAQNINFTLPTGQVLLREINLSLHKGDKAALVGDNGTGKSTLLKILAGEILPKAGIITHDRLPYYIPQHFGQYNALSVAQVLAIDKKLQALHAIIQGSTDPTLFEILADDWDIEARCQQALDRWDLHNVQLTDSFAPYSGGEKTKILLAGIDIHQPDIVMLDEPTNHLDLTGRKQLYDWVETTPQGLLIVSHDRQLLQLCNPILELYGGGINLYGGNYDFYEAKKAEETEALRQQIEHTEKTLKSARKKQQDTLERKQKESARGARQKKKSGVPKIMMKGYKNAGEQTLARLKDTHTKKITSLRTDLQTLKSQEQISRVIRTNFEDASLHQGKTLVRAEKVNFVFPSGQAVFTHDQTYTLYSGDRLSIAGPNGSGKSTLIQLMMGTIPPTSGQLFLAEADTVLLDQEYSIIQRDKTVLQQVEAFNENKLPEHELKIRLNRFLFDRDNWDKPCSALSGGEMMRLALCSIMVKNQAPDIIVLDEPTNNLDLKNIKILTHTIAHYQGTLVVVSHDLRFLEEVGIQREIRLN